MRSLITGGAGFVGSHLSDVLLARGGEVLVLDDLSTGSRRNLSDSLAHGAELVVADIADSARVDEAVKAFRPDCVFHLAAQADVRMSAADPARDALVNVLGTINVLEAARRIGLVPVVFAATGGAVYGEGEGRRLPFVETALPQPLVPYGASKLAGESYVSIYRALHSGPAIALRFANIYGPRQDPHGEAGVVAIFCGKLMAGEELTVYGDGLQTRDYVYVGDAVRALLAAADALVSTDAPPGGPLNVGTGVETSVIELAERLGRVSGIEPVSRFAPARPGEVQRVAIDPAAARAQLGWSAEVALDEGLRASYDSVVATAGATRTGSAPG